MYKNVPDPCKNPVPACEQLHLARIFVDVTIAAANRSVLGGLLAVHRAILPVGADVITRTQMRQVYAQPEIPLILNVFSNTFVMFRYTVGNCRIMRLPAHFNLEHATILVGPAVSTADQILVVSTSVFAFGSS